MVTSPPLKIEKPDGCRREKRVSLDLKKPRALATKYEVNGVSLKETKDNGDGNRPNLPKLSSESVPLRQTKKRKIYHDSDDEEETSITCDKHVNKKGRADICHQDESTPSEWENLDLLEEKDVAMVTEYTNDIFAHLYERELKMTPKCNYLMEKESKYYLRPGLRAILVDGLVEVHEKFRCVQETLLLALNIMDRFLSTNKVTVSKLQLLAVTSLFIAAKFEEINLPKLSNYAYITDGAASTEDIKSAELFMLRSLNFDLAWPNPLNFLRRISKADYYDPKTRLIAKYLLEYAYCCPKFVHLKASYVSAMAMYVARKIATPSNNDKSAAWNATFIHYSGNIDADHDRRFQRNCEALIEDIAYPSTKLEALNRKYSDTRYHGVYSKVFKWCKEHCEKKTKKGEEKNTE